MSNTDSLKNYLVSHLIFLLEKTIITDLNKKKIPKREKGYATQKKVRQVERNFTGLSKHLQVSKENRPLSAGALRAAQ